MKGYHYEENDPTVAAVGSDGTITAVGTGTCVVYVQTINGIWKTVDVKVN